MELDYFGTGVSEETLEGLLRTAVQHTPPTNNRDLMFDPDSWTSGLLDQIRRSPLEALARQVFTAMARSGTPAELRFAAHHDLGRELVAPDALFDALDRATEPETRAGLGRSLASAIRAGHLAYTPRLRAVIGEPQVQDALLGLIALHDHAVFVASLDAIFGTDAPAAKLCTFYAVTGLNTAEVSQLREELAASTLSESVRAATLDAIDSVLAHPATVPGAVRW